MKRGTVKWFNENTQFGFITDDEIGLDVFVHARVIDTKGEKVLMPGEKVDYEYQVQTLYGPFVFTVTPEGLSLQPWQGPSQNTWKGPCATIVRRPILK